MFFRVDRKPNALLGPALHFWQRPAVQLQVAGRTIAPACQPLFLSLFLSFALAAWLVPTIALLWPGAASAEADNQASHTAGVKKEKPPRKHDPLRQAELDNVVQSIKNRNPDFAPRGRKTSQFNIDEPALLLIEKRPADKKTDRARLVNAYYYDYRSNETIHCIVDAKTGAIHQQLRVVDLQLPLIQQEVERAFAIYVQSKHLSELADAYREATGQPLIYVSELHYKAYVFHASANPEKINSVAKRCGKTRCAQLLIYTDQNIALNIAPIVDLSKSKVIQGNTEQRNSQAAPPLTTEHEHTPQVMPSNNELPPNTGGQADAPSN